MGKNDRGKVRWPRVRQLKKKARDARKKEAASRTVRKRG